MARTELDALQVVVAVHAGGSIARAAATLGTSPQAVSARLRRIEDALGLRLFDRTSTGVEPTEAGRSVAAWSAEVLAAANLFDERVADLRAPAAQRVRIAASLTIAEHLAPAWIVEAATTGVARVELSAMNSVEVVARVRAGEVDLGFVETTDVPADLRTRVVAHDELVLVAPPGHPFASRAAVPIRQLAATPLVTREDGSGTRSSFESLVHEHGIDAVADPAQVVASTAAVRAAVVRGAGPAVLSVLAVRDDLALGRLVRVRIADARLVRPLTAVWRGGRAPSATAAAFVELAARTRSSD